MSFLRDILGSPLVWIAVFVFFVVAVLPRLDRLGRMVRAKRRFIRDQGAQLNNPQNADARYQLGNIYAEGGRWRLALEYAEAAVRIARESPLFEEGVPYHFLLLLGDALFRHGRTDEAAKTYEEALWSKSQMGHAEAYFGLGRAQVRLGDLDRALQSLKTSIEENASNLEGYFRLAQAAAKAGKAEETARAAAEFRRVAASLPRFARRRKRMRWRLAFLFFPITRWIL